jgi:hypothetical protein
MSEIENTDIVDDVVESSGNEETAKKKSPDPVPYARFHQVVQQRRDLEAKIVDLEKQLNGTSERYLEETEQFKELAAQRKAELETVKQMVESQTAVLEKYRSSVSALVDENTSSWPEELKAFDPGIDSDPLERLQWSQKAAALVSKLSAPQVNAAVPGTGPKPAPKPAVVEPKEARPLIDVRRSF